MALLAPLALFFSFDFAVVSAALLIRAFVASNDQVKHLQAAVPRGTVLNINRDGGLSRSHFRLFHHSPFFTDITTAGQVSTAVQALTIAFITLSALAIFYRSKTRPKFFTILGSLLAFASLWLLSVTIAFTVIFATKSARVSASIGGMQLSQSVIDAQARALGVSPIYKDQPYREWQPFYPGLYSIHTTRTFPVLHAAILPWFTWLFTTVAAVAMFSESRVDSTREPINDKSITGVRERTPSIV